MTHSKLTALSKLFSRHHEMFRGSYILRCEILFTIVYVGMALRLYVKRSADNAEMILQAFMFTMIYDSLL